MNSILNIFIIFPSFKKSNFKSLRNLLIERRHFDRQNDSKMTQINLRCLVLAPRYSPYDAEVGDFLDGKSIQIFYSQNDSVVIEFKVPCLEFIRDEFSESYVRWVRSVCKCDIILSLGLDERIKTSIGIVWRGFCDTFGRSALYEFPFIADLYAQRWEFLTTQITKLRVTGDAGVTIPFTHLNSDSYTFITNVLCFYSTTAKRAGIVDFTNSTLSEPSEISRELCCRKYVMRQLVNAIVKNENLVSHLLLDETPMETVSYAMLKCARLKEGTKYKVMQKHHLMGIIRISFAICSYDGDLDDIRKMRRFGIPGSTRSIILQIDTGLGKTFTYMTALNLCKSVSSGMILTKPSIVNQTSRDSVDLFPTLQQSSKPSVNSYTDLDINEESDIRKAKDSIFNSFQTAMVDPITKKLVLVLDEVDSIGKISTISVTAIGRICDKYLEEFGFLPLIIGTTASPIRHDKKDAVATYQYLFARIETKKKYRTDLTGASESDSTTVSRPKRQAAINTLQQSKEKQTKEKPKILDKLLKEVEISRSKADWQSPIDTFAYQYPSIPLPDLRLYLFTPPVAPGGGGLKPAKWHVISGALTQTMQTIATGKEKDKIKVFAAMRASRDVDSQDEADRQYDNVITLIKLIARYNPGDSILIADDSVNEAGKQTKKATQWSQSSSSQPLQTGQDEGDEEGEDQPDEIETSSSSTYSKNLSALFQHVSNKLRDGSFYGEDDDDEVPGDQRFDSSETHLISGNDKPSPEVMLTFAENLASKPRLLFLSSHLGAGLNLQGFCHTIILGMPYTYASTKQLLGRTNRIGQKSDIVSYYFFLNSNPGFTAIFNSYIRRSAENKEICT